MRDYHQCPCDVHIRHEDRFEFLQEKYFSPPQLPCGYKLKEIKINYLQCNHVY